MASTVAPRLGEEDQDAPASVAARLAPQVGLEKAREREQDAEDEEEVRLDQAREEEELEIGRDHQAGEQAQPRAAEAHAEPRGQRGHAQGRQRRAEPRRRLPRPQRPEGPRYQPVEQRGLVEVPHAVDMGRDPVAVAEHLPRDHGVEALRGIDEGRAAKAGKKSAAATRATRRTTLAVRLTAS